jgi:hypothetical protein
VRARAARALVAAARLAPSLAGAVARVHAAGLAFGLALGLGLDLAPSAAPAAEPAAGGRPLLAAAEETGLALVGTVGGVRRLDHHGYVADLHVERTLAGDAPAGATLTIGFEELAASRPPRLREGVRVLVALEPRARDSIWRERLPGASLRVLAAKGEAFLRDPDPPSVEALARYLALAPAERAGEAGALALAELVAAALPPLAEGALDRLERVGAELATRLDDRAAGSLAAALADRARPLQIRLRLAALAERGRLEALSPALLAIWADGGEASALRGAALVALQALDGGAPAGALASALESRDPALRASAVRADLRLGAARLSAIAAGDPAPEVRRAAVERLGARPAGEALAPVLRALGDADAGVREAAIVAAGGFGEPAVADLVSLVERSEPERARAPAAALALAGAAGRVALQRIAEEHPEEQMRAFARVLLGEPPFPGH